MSLLIDALKQAEASRKQTSPTTAKEEESPSLTLLDDLAASEQPANERQRATVRPSGASVAQRQAAARELFDVKQEPVRWPVLFAILALCASVAGGAYVWWATQAQGLQPGSAFQTKPIMQPQAAVPTISPAVPENAPETVATKQQPSPPKTPTRETLASQDRTLASPQHLKPQLESPAAADTDEPESMPSELAPIRKRQKEAASISPLAASAYEAYVAGDVALSRSRYRDTLKQEPRNIEALLALATIAIREGRTDEAERLFKTVLTIDPRNTTAQSQLALFGAEADPSLAESRLRQLATEQPNAATTFFALGILYTQQQRWREAQQAFFQAYTLDSSNADAIYNLAVSLDHLGQARLAAQYYEKAALSAQPSMRAFDTAVALKRAQALSESASLSTQ